MLYAQFHVNDWLSGTRFLSAVEKGIYMDLLMLYYSEERPIVRTYFERITKGYTDEERKAFDFVISEFFTEEEDGFHNARCDKEIAAYREKSEKARKSVEARWKKQALKNERNTTVIRPNNERTTVALLTDNQITDNQDISKEIKKEKSTRLTVEKPEGIDDDLWAEYKALRKAKRATVSKTALQALAKEAKKAGLTVEEAMREQVARGWQAFKAEYMESKTGKQTVAKSHAFCPGPDYYPEEAPF